MEENVRLIERVFDILEQLSAASAPMGVSDIAKATGISKSTVQSADKTIAPFHYTE